MNILKIGKLTLITVLGSLMWAGCASSPSQSEEQFGLEKTTDVLVLGPDTQPQYNNNGILFDSPFQAGWTVEDIE